MSQENQTMLTASSSVRLIVSSHRKPLDKDLLNLKNWSTCKAYFCCSVTHNSTAT